MDATVRDASGVTAREVLHADAANLASHGLTAPAKEGEADVYRSTAGDLMKSSRERAEEKREEKLELVREQVESGSLRIRKMTDEERRRYPPRSAPPKRPSR